MCDKAVKDDSSFLHFVPDWFMIKEWIDMWYDDYYDDGDGHHWDDDGDYWDEDFNDKDKFFYWYYGNKKRKAVYKYPWLLKYLPDWFVTQQQLKLWHDDDYYCNDDEIIKWYDGYKKRKAQKVKLKEVLMPISWQYIYIYKITFFFYYKKWHLYYIDKS